MKEVVNLRAVSGRARWNQLFRASVRRTSVDPTEARKATVRRFGRSDRSALVKARQHQVLDLVDS
jgi:hypothetical protein